MILVGMLDSPYVRRVAVALPLLGLGFEHRPLSVFRTFDDFAAINPVVKAPTLVADDGTVLMDSTLILDHAESVAGRSLWPRDPAERTRALRVAGLALAALDKSVSVIYERWVRPPEKVHEPWIARVRGQLAAALAALEAEAQRRPLAADAATIDHGSLVAAVGWHFLCDLLPELADPARHPALAAHSARCEALPSFAAAPHGEGTARPL